MAVSLTKGIGDVHAVKPKAILIDFYGTICAGDRDAVVSTCRTIVGVCGLSVSPEQFAVQWGERYFDVVARSNHEAFQTLYECEVASLRTTLEHFGCNPDPAPFLVELENYWADPPIHADALEFLRANDLPICCVSNADSAPLTAAIEKHGLAFDRVLTSEAVRCYKPDPVIFRHALEAVGVEPSDAVHIGDSLHSDIAGASGAGIPSVWVCRENRIHDVGNHQPDRQISILTELFDLL